MICDECETVAHCTKHGCVPKHQALDRMAENARELGLDYEPVQEPVALIRTWHKNGDQHAELVDWGTALQFLPDGEHCLYTTPPAQPAPVPLTNTEFCEQWFKQTGRIMGTDKQLLLQAKRVTEAAHGITASPKNRKDALRKLLLSEDGLTAQECEWVNEVNEGDKVKLRGGQSVALVKSVYRQKGLAPDYYTLILANGDTLDLSGDEIADIYEPAAPEKGQP